MECLKCDAGAVLDRVVVDGVTEEPLGALCDSCQPKDIKLTFEDDVWHGDSGCAVCADRAHYYLPQIELRIEFDGPRADDIEYCISDSTARLCPGHFEELLKGEASEPSAAPSAVSH